MTHRFISLISISLFAATLAAQSANPIGRTWTGDGSSLLKRVKANRSAPARNPQIDLAGVTFSPTTDSGIAKDLVEVLGTNPQQKALLLEALQGIKQAYEENVTKAGKANNLVTAFTFFIAVNVTAHTQTELTSEASTETLFLELQPIIASTPEITRLSNLEKQKMHDWLVYMAGFVMTNYLNAQQIGDPATLKTMKALSGYALQLVLGVDPATLSFRDNKLVLDDNSVSAASGATDHRLVGTWNKSSSSPWGLSPGRVSTNAGYFKGQYEFNPDGTYFFKGESWGGYLRSDEFTTIEERGRYAINGNELKIAPATSSATVRNSSGVVKTKRNLPLESVAYKWSLHYFEGIGETNLVLQPAQPTARDGSYAGNSDFPNSYLYSKNGKLEWRF